MLSCSVLLDPMIVAIFLKRYFSYDSTREV